MNFFLLPQLAHISSTCTQDLLNLKAETKSFVIVDERCSTAIKTGKGDDAYFVTFTIVDWLSVLLDDKNKMGLTYARVAKVRKQKTSSAGRQLSNNLFPHLL